MSCRMILYPVLIIYLQGESLDIELVVLPKLIS